MPKGNPKSPTLHRWAILDRSGKTRGTCTETTKALARATFNFRGIGLNASGWKIVDRGPAILPKEGDIEPGGIRGPVEPATPKPRRWKFKDFSVGDTILLKAGHWAVREEGIPEGTTAKLVSLEGNNVQFRTDLKVHPNRENGMTFTPWEYTEAEVGKVEAEPRPFKVGDQVRGNGHFSGTEYEGEIIGFEGKLVKIFSPKLSDKPLLNPGSVILLEPAPQPKPEAVPPGVLLAQVREATGIPFAEEPDLVKAVRGIASQMDRHRAKLKDQGENLAAIAQERDAARREMTENYKNFREAQDRAEAAEAKLGDIQAIMRVRKIDPGLSTEDAADMISTVLAR
jgi:hypothetical protein